MRRLSFNFAFNFVSASLFFVFLFSFFVQTAYAVNGNIFYDFSGSNSIKLRNFTTPATVSDDVSLTALSAVPNGWLKVASSPVRDEYIVGGMTGFDLNVQVCSPTNGTNCDVSNFSTSFSAGLVTGGNPAFDISYESQSGDALIVYRSGGDFIYRVWSNTSRTWNSGTATTTGGNGNVQNVRLLSDPSTDKIFILLSTASNKLLTYLWDGSNLTEHFNSTNKSGSINCALNSAGVSYKFDGEWNADGSKFMMACSSGANSIKYNVYTPASSTWLKNDFSHTISGIEVDINHIDLFSNPFSSGTIGLTAMPSGGATNNYLTLWNGASWGSATTTVAFNTAGTTNYPSAGAWLSSNTGVVFQTSGDTNALKVTKVVNGTWSDVSVSGLTAPQGSLSNRSFSLYNNPGNGYTLALVQDSDNGVNGYTISTTTSIVTTSTHLLVADAGSNNTPFDFDWNIPKITAVSGNAMVSTSGGSKTITGSNFIQDSISSNATSTEVSINGQSATITAISDTSITITTSATSTSLNNSSAVLKVRNISTGKYATTSVTFLAPPTVTGVTGNNPQTTAGGKSITITGTNFHSNMGGSATSVLIGLNPATNVVYVNPTTLTAVAPAKSAGTHDVSVINQDTGGLGTYLASITYVAPPVVTLNRDSFGKNGGLAGGLITITHGIGTPIRTTGGVKFMATSTEPESLHNTAWTGSGRDYNFGSGIIKTAGNYTIRIYGSSGTDDNGIYVDMPFYIKTYQQSAYRWFGNSNTLSAGTILAGINASSTFITGDIVRLRIATKVLYGTNYPLASTDDFKLQVASTTGSCSTGTYYDVSASSGAVRFYDNTSLTGGATSIVSDNDPVTGVTRVTQKYIESNNFTSVATTTVDNHGIWDFSLVNNSAVRGTKYCFRMARTPTGTDTFEGYDNIAEIVNPNTAPELQNVSASQSLTTGTVAINYEAKDTDTSFGGIPNVVTPSFEYKVANGNAWTDITAGYLGGEDTSNKTVSASTFTPYTATWNALGQLGAQYYNGSVYVRVKINDNESINNTALATTTPFTLDTTKPSIATKSYDARNTTVALTSSDNSNIEYRFSNNTDFSADGVNATSGTWVSVGAVSTTTSLSWTAGSTEGNYKAVYLGVRDVYGNATTTTIVAPHTPLGFAISDTSNTTKGTYSAYLSWIANTASSTAVTEHYVISTSTDGINYSSSITTTDTDYTFTNLNPLLTYYYKISAKSTLGSYSGYSVVLNDRPGRGENQPPTFDNTFDSDNTTGVTISQVSATTSPHWGKVMIQYKVKDSDAEAPLQFTPSFQYNIGGGWTGIATTTSIDSAGGGLQAVSTSVYTTYTAYWSATSTEGTNGIYNTSLQVKVTVDDGLASNNTSYSVSAPITLDTNKPVVGSSSLLINGSADGAVGTASIKLTLASIYGDTASETIYAQFSEDNTTWYGANVNPIGLSSAGGVGNGFSLATSTLSGLEWDWTLGNGVTTIYTRILDNFGNSRTSYSTDTSSVSVDAPPVFDTSYGSNSSGILLTQITDAGADLGKLKIQYSVRDPDDVSVTPSFEYNSTGIQWSAVSSEYLQANDLVAKAVDNSLNTTHEAIWNASSQISNNFVSNLQIRVTLTGGGDGRTATSTATTTLDVKKPVATFSVDSKTDEVILTASDNSQLQYRVSNSATFDNDAVIWVTPVLVNGSFTATTSMGLSADVYGFETVYYGVKDNFGNVATSSATAPYTPIDMLIHDATDLNAFLYKELISWMPYVSTTTAPFEKYIIYRATTTEDVYTEIGQVTDISKNYFLDKNVLLDTLYYYKVTTKTSNGDYSSFSLSVSDTANGIDGVDSTLLEVTNIGDVIVDATWAKFTYDTTKYAISNIAYSTTSINGNHSYSSLTTSNSMLKEHSLSLEELKPNTNYVYKIIATDTSEESMTPVLGTFTTIAGPEITDVDGVPSAKGAVISWKTNIPANSSVFYATTTAILASNNASQVGNSSATANSDNTIYQHEVKIVSLTPNTKYFYYVKSISSADNLNNIVTDKNGGEYYTFTTERDVIPPKISGVATLLVSRNSAVLTWLTDEPATSRGSFGLSSGSYTNETILDSYLSTNHSVIFGGLLAETKYYSKVHSNDEAENSASSAEHEFTTSDSPVAVYLRAPSVDAESTEGEDAGVSKTDKTAPIISDIKVSDIGPFSALVSFTSNEDTLAFIEFGDGGKLDLSVSNSNYGTSHKIKLYGLKLNTEYSFRVKAQDRSSNFRAEEGLKFKTTFAVENLDSLVKLEDTSLIQDKLDDLIESLMPTLVPPFIGDIVVSEVEGSSVLVKWKTNIKTYGGVLFASDDKYASGTAKAYNQEISDTEEKDTFHEARLLNLLPGTKYHYKVRAFAIPGVVRESENSTFVTKLSKLDPTVFDITSKSFKIRWQTENPASSYVEYKNIKLGQTDVRGSEIKTTNHLVEVVGLLPGQEFEARAYSIDENINSADSALFVVRIPRDNTSPVISGLKIDNSFVPGRNDRIQTVVSLRTSEPSYANILYEVGGSSGDGSVELKNAVGLTDSLSTSHNLIITNLKPGTVYRLQVVAVDEYGNKTSSPIRSLITPMQTKSVFDVIIRNFEDTFKFLQ